MAILIRRSNLIVPVTDGAAVAASWRSGADALTLDLEDAVPPARKAEARDQVKAAVMQARRGGAEVFVRVNKPSLQADLAAAVWPGLSGIMLPQIESADEVRAADQLLTGLEASRGLAKGSLQVIALLESARAVWDIRSIITASARITQVALDESDLAASLGIWPTPEHDPLSYARARLVVEAVAAKIQAVGMAWPLGLEQRRLPAVEINGRANITRNMGMKGVLCCHDSWVEPVNRAFTPTAELVAYNRRVRQAFAEGVATGTASVPLDGRIIDVPVDVWAQMVIATAEACDARDADKQRALQQMTGS